MERPGRYPTPERQRSGQEQPVPRQLLSNGSSMSSFATSLGYSARQQVGRRERDRLTRFWGDQDACHPGFADDVFRRISAEIRQALSGHVVDVSHVVVEARDAPPEPDRLAEA